VRLFIYLFSSAGGGDGIEFCGMHFQDLIANFRLGFSHSKAIPRGGGVFSWHFHSALADTAESALRVSDKW
jgi:hypothetical protein